MIQDGIVGALDIGGTKILAGLVSRSGTLLARQRLETRAKDGADDVLERAVDTLRRLVKEAGYSWEAVQAVGCSVPGPLDRVKGVVVFSPNLGWHDVPLARLLRERLGVPIVIDDDANCAALGEAAVGAARHSRQAVYLTISTGIGGGVVIDGRMYRGAHGLAGEIGHMTLEPDGPACACGNVGCFEALASGSAIAQRARQALLHGDETMLRTMVPDPTELRAEHVIQAAEAGDSLACQIIETTSMYLGLGLAAVANIFDPEVIVVGGGVIGANNTILSRAVDVLRARALAPINRLVQVVPAALGDESALWGAAALIWEDSQDAHHDLTMTSAE